MDETNVEVLDLSVDEAEMIDTFAGLFDDEVEDLKTTATYEEQDQGTEFDGTEPEDDTEPEEEFIEIDTSAFIPVKIGEEEIEVTIEELSKSYIREQDYSTKVSQLTNKAAEILEMERRAIEGLELSKLECDLILEDVKDVDFSTMDAEQYKEMSLKKARLQHKSAEIKSRLDAMKPRHEEIAKQEKVVKAKECLSHLQREVPGFTIDMYNSALGHAVSVLGVDAGFIKTCTDAGVIKALIAANENYVSPARLKKSRMPVKTAKVKPAVTKTKDYSREDDLLALGESLF